MREYGDEAFQGGKAVWLTGLSEAMNIQAGFRAVFKAGVGRHRLRIAGSTIYRIYLNGQFVGHGPARCGHGHFRVDAWELPVVAGENLLAIEVAGYNINGYAYLDQPSFVQAEVICGNKVLAATGAKAFTAYRLKERVQRVQRYSLQRPAVEVYKLSSRSADWRMKPTCTRKPHPVEVLAPRTLVARGVSYPVFETRQVTTLTAAGTVAPRKNPKLRWGYAWNGPTATLKTFPPDGRTVYPSHELEALASRFRSRKPKTLAPDEPIALGQNQFVILDLGTNLSGFVGLQVTCKEPVDLYLAFDELSMPDGDVSLTRYHCANEVKYSLKPGCYALETFEPYTLKFLKLIALGGACECAGIYLREYACPDAYRGQFAASDPQLVDLFEAARQTFRQNAVDIFMDCPGRERAGWLCDSFFTGRAERDLCGSNPIEHNFLRNFLFSTHYPDIPAGMLPMCYPSDHYKGTFIPNWAMWFVIELEEYLQRTADRDLVEDLRRKVYGLLDYFRPFLNSDGLLEKLDSWIFIEWSEAAKFVQDVSYPSNMLYAGMLDAAARLYADASLSRQAARVRETIRAQSFDGEFFVDNAIRNADGTLEVTGNRTETCQYYAFFFDVATPETHPALWDKLLSDFGPRRDAASVWPEIHPANAFIGFFLRLDVLSRYRQPGLVLDQLYQSYVPMAETTGTLWEHKDTTASCNHGFAGHVAHILYRDILGVRVDWQTKRVTFQPPDVPLTWCRGRIPVAGNWIEAEWTRDSSGLSRRISVPRGFTVG